MWMMRLIRSRTAGPILGFLLLTACGGHPGAVARPTTSPLASPSATLSADSSPTPSPTPSASPSQISLSNCPGPRPANVPAPPPRIGAALSYDGVSGKLLLFSGVKGNGTVSSDWIFDDTWSWDGRRWTQLHPPDSPPGRSFGNMVFDENARQTILFGGGSPNSDPGNQDTWSWNGSNWIPLHPSVSPGLLIDASSAYDAAAQSVVLFGPGGARLNTPQTWLWSGTTWLRSSSKTSPSFRSQAAMAYDGARGTVVLFSGYDFPGSGLNDIWTWDGSAWQQRQPQTIPPGGSGNAAYDAVHRLVVLFVQGQTWTWDGTNWTQQHPALSPCLRLFASMTYDPAIGRVVLFGGKSQWLAAGLLQESVNNELWSWDGSSWKQEG
jgi:hypothetical protein